MRRHKKFCMLWMLLLFTLCSCSGAAPIQSEWGHRAADTSYSDAAAMKRSDPLVFGIIYPMAHPFYEKITESIEAASEPYPIQLIVKAPDEINLEQQIRMMETLMKQKVHGIAIDPIDPEALAPFINKAVQSGIPVVCFESDVPGSERYSYIGSDPLKEGTLMGQVIDRELNGKGMMMIEGSLSGSPQQSQRLEGILQYMRKQTEIQVLDIRYHNGNSELAIADMQHMIDAHPHFDALVSLDMISSTSSILVWKSQGLKRYAVTFGLTPDVKEALLNGQIHSVISANEHLWGDKIIEQLLAAHNKIPSTNWIDTGYMEVGQRDIPNPY
ncbi:sugar ABC transporter substrate-binding protein [Paenibacillus chartarius]|uniref:Sugar ABC transporter substrate-binding protein n=1 Tax=Paenibacillus chartarius TaxID=747481 RepID=A0ABV6DHL6_9BACL